MERNTIIMLALIGLIVIALVQVIEVSAIKSKFVGTGYSTSNTGNAVAVSSGKLDTTGWTENEIMNYEMHGTIPARAQGSVSGASAGPTMVGGC